MKERMCMAEEELEPKPIVVNIKFGFPWWCRAVPIDGKKFPTKVLFVGICCQGEPEWIFEFVWSLTEAIKKIPHIQTWEQTCRLTLMIWSTYQKPSLNQPVSRMRFWKIKKKQRTSNSRSWPGITYLAGASAHYEVKWLLQHEGRIWS